MYQANNLPTAHAMCTRCGLHYVPQWGTAGSCPACGNGRPWWGLGKPIATPGNNGQRAHTPYAHPATTGPYYQQAQQLVTAVQRLAGMHAGGQLTPAQVHQRATAYMQQATALNSLAYQAGRGYAANTRVTGYAFAVAWDLAVETNAVASNA